MIEEAIPLDSMGREEVNYQITEFSSEKNRKSEDFMEFQKNSSGFLSKRPIGKRELQVQTF